MRIKLNAIYDMVAESLAVTTRDRSAERIKEAVICCLAALYEDGHEVEKKPMADACVRTIQGKLDKLPKLQ